MPETETVDQEVADARPPRPGEGDSIGDFKIALAEIGEVDPDEVARAEKQQTKLIRIQDAMLRIFGAKLERIYEILQVELSEEHLPSDAEVWINLDDGSPSGRIIVIRCEGGGD